MNARPAILVSDPRARARAFTLIEVVLALAIATGLLIVALLFYRQATELRAQILRESERNTAIRLVMERLAGDLRETVVLPNDGGGFIGGPDSLSLVRTGQSEAGSAGPGLVRISYVTVKSADGTNQSVVGIDRREQALGAPARPRTNFLETLPAGTNALASAAPVPSGPLLTEDIRRMRFRYWNGAAWTSFWTNGAPPTGVEIVLGPDPDETTAFAVADESSPTEPVADTGGTSPSAGDSGIVLFRRVVFIPAGVVAKHASDDAFSDPAAP